MLAMVNAAVRERLYFPGHLAYSVPMLESNYRGGTMRRSSISTFAVSLIALVAIAVGPAAAEEKKAKEGQLTGTVRVLNKQTSMITVRKGSIERTIVYNSSTQFMEG